MRGGGGFQRTTFKELNAFGGLYSTLALMDDELAAALLGRRERAQLDDIPHTSLSLSRSHRSPARSAGRPRGQHVADGYVSKSRTSADVSVPPGLPGSLDRCRGFPDHLISPVSK